MDRFVFDDGHTCFIVWRLNIGKQTPFKSCFQAFFQLLHIRRAAIRGQDNLLVILVEVIKGMEKFLLRGFLSGDKLDIIHQEKVCIAVFVAKFEVFAALQRFDHLVGKLIAFDIDNIKFGMLVMDMPCNSIEQMCLAKAGGAVNKQGVVAVCRIIGDGNGSAVGKLVGRADDEIVEGELWIKFNKVRLSIFVSEGV